jgi:hypothetical protein
MLELPGKRRAELLMSVKDCVNLTRYMGASRLADPKDWILLIPVIEATWPVAFPREVVSALARVVEGPKVPIVEPYRLPVERSCQEPW